MSTNVDGVECLSGELTITDEGKAWLLRFDNEDDDNAYTAENGADATDDWWPEIPPSVKKAPDGRELVDMCWCGEGSGNAAHYGALKKFFSFTRGTAEFVFTWEGGSFFTGHRVVDGVMTTHEVEMKLGKEVKS